MSTTKTFSSKLDITLLHGVSLASSLVFSNCLNLLTVLQSSLLRFYNSAIFSASALTASTQRQLRLTLKLSLIDILRTSPACDWKDLLRLSSGWQWYLKDQVICSKAVSVFILQSDLFRLALASTVIRFIQRFSLFFQEERFWTSKSRFPSFSLRFEFYTFISYSSCSLLQSSLLINSSSQHFAHNSAIFSSKQLFEFFNSEHYILISCNSFWLSFSAFVKLIFQALKRFTSSQYSLISFATSLICVFCLSLTTQMSAIYLLRLTQISCFCSDSSLIFYYSQYFKLYRSANFSLSSANSLDCSTISFSLSARFASNYLILFLFISLLSSNSPFLLSNYSISFLILIFSSYTSDFCFITISYSSFILQSIPICFCNSV